MPRLTDLFNAIAIKDIGALVISGGLWIVNSDISFLTLQTSLQVLLSAMAFTRLQVSTHWNKEKENVRDFIKKKHPTIQTNGLKRGQCILVIDLHKTDWRAPNRPKGICVFFAFMPRWTRQEVKANWWQVDRSVVAKPVQRRTPKESLSSERRWSATWFSFGGGRSEHLNVIQPADAFAQSDSGVISNILLITGFLTHQKVGTKLVGGCQNGIALRDWNKANQLRYWYSTVFYEWRISIRGKRRHTDISFKGGSLGALCWITPHRLVFMSTIWGGTFFIKKFESLFRPNWRNFRHFCS